MLGQPVGEVLGRQCANRILSQSVEVFAPVPEISDLPGRTELEALFYSLGPFLLFKSCCGLTSGLGCAAGNGLDELIY